jgi:predicted alpha/beta hydrolase family esterase
MRIQSIFQLFITIATINGAKLPSYQKKMVDIIKPRCLIIPGCGCSPVKDANWYLWMKNKLIESEVFSEVILEDMPDPTDAKEVVWLPFILNKLKADENTVMIGHSSGAEASMRFLEKNRLKGCVLVSACHTDLGSESERLAGYYNRPWDWTKIKSNTEWILQYHSTDDPFIPISEADYVADNLKSEYFRFEDKSHFFAPKDVESAHVVEDIIRKLSST